MVLNVKCSNGQLRGQWSLRKACEMNKEISQSVSGHGDKFK